MDGSGTTRLMAVSAAIFMRCVVLHVSSALEHDREGRGSSLATIVIRDPILDA